MNPSTSKMQLCRLCNSLPQLLKRICGKVHFPNDGGDALINYLRTTNTPLLTARDASLKDGNGAHAWIPTNNNIHHFSNPNTFISGAGAFDGCHNDLSSSRGELQSQMAIAIMASNLLKTQQATKMVIHIYGNNKAVQQ
jgi:hypothetical protein